MHDRELYSKVVRFQRTAVDNTFAIFTSFQGYGEKILKKSLAQNPWLPEKSKSTCMGLADTCLHGSKTLRKFIDQGFDEIERLVAQSSMTQKSEKPETKSPPSRPAAASGQKHASEKKSTAPKSAATTHKSTAKSTSSEPVGSTVKPQKQSTAPPAGITPVSAPAATPAATPVRTAATSAASPAATPKPAPTPATSPVTTSTTPPTATTAAAKTKPSEPSEKTAKGGVTTAGKST